MKLTATTNSDVVLVTIGDEARRQARLAALREVRDEVTRIRQDQNTLLTEEGRVIATTIDAMIAKEER